MHTDELLRQTARQSRKMWKKMDPIEKAKERLLSVERDMLEGKRVVEGIQAQINQLHQQAQHLVGGLMKMEGARIELRMLLGTEAPPIPEGFSGFSQETVNGATSTVAEAV